MILLHISAEPEKTGGYRDRTQTGSIRPATLTLVCALSVFGFEAPVFIPEVDCFCVKYKKPLE